MILPLRLLDSIIKMLYDNREMKEKTERNQRLYEAWKSGKYKSISSVARLFKVAPEVAWRIIRREQWRHTQTNQP